MVTTRISASDITVVSRNIALTREVLRSMLEEPEVLDRLPANFELVVLPDDDPELRLYNLELLDKYGSEGKPVVFVRMSAGQKQPANGVPVSFYVPVIV
jgi:hypothetical protein